MEAVRKDGLALEFASETLRSDKEVVMAAVRQHGCALECAGDSLQIDSGLVLAYLHNRSGIQIMEKIAQSLEVFSCFFLIELISGSYHHVL